MKGEAWGDTTPATGPAAASHVAVAAATAAVVATVIAFAASGSNLQESNLRKKGVTFLIYITSLIS